MPQASTSRLDSLRSNIALANGQVDMMPVLVWRAQATMPSKRRESASWARVGRSGMRLQPCRFANDSGVACGDFE